MQDLQNQELPTEISFTTTDVERMSTRKQIKLGWAQFVVVTAEKLLSKTGDYMFALTCKPLDSEKVPANITIRNNVILPFANPSVEGHVPKDTGGLNHQYLVSVAPEKFERFPRWDKNLNGYVRASTGEVIDKQAATTLRREINKAVATEMQRRWKDSDLFVNDMFYAQVVQNGQYRNMNNITSEPPPEADVRTADFIASSTDE
jgi:hypothetical protein